MWFLLMGIRNKPPNRRKNEKTICPAHGVQRLGPTKTTYIALKNEGKRQLITSGGPSIIRYAFSERSSDAGNNNLVVISFIRGFKWLMGDHFHSSKQINRSSLLSIVIPNHH